MVDESVDHGNNMMVVQFDFLFDAAIFRGTSTEMELQHCQFYCTKQIDNNFVFNELTPASQVEVGCPWARGLEPQYTPRRKNTDRPTNPQPSHKSPRAQPPTIAPVTLRLEAQWK